MKQAQHLSGYYRHPIVRLPKNQVPYPPTNCHHATIHHLPYIKFNIPTKRDTWRPVAREIWSSPTRLHAKNIHQTTYCTTTRGHLNLTNLWSSTTRPRDSEEKWTHHPTEEQDAVHKYPHQPYSRTELHYKYWLVLIDDKSNHMRPGPHYRSIGPPKPKDKTSTQR